MATLDNNREIEIEKMRNSCLYPVVNLSIFDTIANLVLEDFTLEHEQEAVSSYKEYLENIFSMKKNMQENFLNGIKVKEIIDTQLLEEEDSYLLAVHMQTHRQSAMDYLLKQQQSPFEKLTKEEIIKSHKKLLQGTSTGRKYAEHDYRQDNQAFVAKRKNGEVIIKYFSIDFKNIEEAIMNLTMYYNDKKLHNNHTLIKPIIIHGLVGALQIFDDGNTRFGRMLQNIKIYELTDMNLKYTLSAPALYSSKSYFNYREQYREKLGKVAINPNNESWNNWINFNLNRMEDQIYYINNKLSEYKKMR